MNAAFERVLPRLVTAFDRGVLVPFIGGRMSRKTCPDWPHLVTLLEAAESTTTKQAGNGAKNHPHALIRRADRAVKLLRRRQPHGGRDNLAEHSSALHSGPESAIRLNPPHSLVFSGRS